MARVRPRGASPQAKAAIRKAAPQPAPDATGGAVTRDQPDSELREHMVAEAAYYRALKRGFDGGDPNEDWFAAEREIDERYGVSH